MNTLDINNLNTLSELSLAEVEIISGGCDWFAPHGECTSGTFQEVAKDAITGYSATGGSLWGAVAGAAWGMFNHGCYLW